MIFDTISVKARWEQWCRWNCDLRVINARKKGIFCHTGNVAMTPRSRPTTSLWGVAAKWSTRAPKLKLTLCPSNPQGYSHISLSLSGRILKEYRNIVSASKQNSMRYSMGFAKSHSLKCSRHKWAWCSAARKSARLNCINLIHFRLTAGQLRRSSCIVIPVVVCELLQFAATQ